MNLIKLEQSAIDKIMEDNDVARWLKDPSADNVPILGYFSRSFSKYNDGTEAEHGDGFVLSTIDPSSAEETRGIVVKTVALAPDLNILVGGDEFIMSRSFSIGWSKWKFTYEPVTSP